MTQPAESPQNRLFPPFPRLGRRLHIFPALIPLMELLPWLLGAVGALASVTHLAFWRTHGRKFMVAAMACFIAAGGVVLWREAHRPSEIEGSVLLAEKDWPKLTRYADPPRGARMVATKPDFAPLWTVATEHESLATPVLAGNLMLIGTFDNTVEARSLDDGALLWSLRKHEPVFTNVAALKDEAFVGEGLHTALSAGLTAFSLPEGKVLWERQFRSHVEAPVLLEEKTRRLWTAAGDEGVWCLDYRDGAALWRAHPGHIDSTPLLEQGQLFVSAWPDMHVDKIGLFSLDPDTGREKWKVMLPGGPMGSPQAAEGGVILVTTAVGQVGPQKSTDKGWASAVSLDGKLLWTVKLPNISLPEPLVPAGSGIVIHTLKTGEIMALNIKDGSKAWSVKLGREIDAPAALEEHTTPPLVAAIATDGAAVILNAETGAELRRFNLKQGGYAAPVFDGDRLYMTTPHSIVAYGGVLSLVGGLWH